MAITLGVIAVAALQTYTLWDYRGDRVDESELVHFAVGFLGRDFDPGWYGYGSLGMYLLFGVYALLGIPALLLGPFDSVSEYAQLVFSGGYFFVVGRYTFAVLGVVTVVLYADIARRLLHLPRWMVAAYVFVAVTSVDAVFYANHIRSDRLVSFFVALTLWSAVRSEQPRWLYVSALATAGAIASKMSALPLALFALGLAAYRWRRGQATAEQATLSVLLFAFALVVFQPFVSYTERIGSLLGRGGDPPFRWTAARYGTVVERFGGLGRFVAGYVGVPVLALLAGLSVARAWRHVLVPALALLALLVLPYATSAELRTYWFLPAYDLLRFLALAGAGGLWVWARGRGWTFPPAALARRPRLRVAAGVALVLILAAPGLWNAAEVAHRLATTKTGNRELAQAWIEDELLGVERVRLDAEFSYHLPRVYDPQALHTSKLISRAFIFDRWDHDYLNRVFTQYLVRDYGPRHGLGSVFAELRALRLDPSAGDGARLEFSGVRLCNAAGNCRPVTELPRTNDVQVERLQAGDIAARTTGDDPYFVLFDDLAVPLDGSHTLELTAVQPATLHGGVYVDVGGGFSEALRINFDATRDVSVTLYAAGPATDRDLVRRLSPATVGSGGIAESDHGAYFVTSPAIYQRFLWAQGDQLSPERDDVLQRIEAGYRELLAQPLVQRFDQGSGPTIEIYRLGD